MNWTHRYLLQRPRRRTQYVEVLIVFFIIALLLSLAVREAKVPLVKAKGVGLFYDFATARVALVESFALNGVWPDRQAFNFSTEHNGVLEAQAVHGVVTLERQGRHEDGATNNILSLRPALGTSGATVLWVCGNATVPQGMQVSGVNRTTLKPAELYVVCR